MDPGSGRAPGDGRHDGNVITVFQGRRFLLQVADVFVVEIEVNEGAQFALVGVEVLAQVGMQRDERIHGFADGRSRNVHGRLFADVLP